MKLTKSRLKQIIYEELSNLREASKPDKVHVTLKTPEDKDMSPAAARVLKDVPRRGTVDKKDWDTTPVDKSVKVTYADGRTRQLNKKYLKLNEIAIVLGDPKELEKIASWPVKDVSTPEKAKDEFSKLTKSVQGKETIDEGTIPFKQAQALAKDHNVNLSDGHAAILGKRFQNTPKGRKEFVLALRDRSYKKMLEEQGSLESAPEDAEVLIPGYGKLTIGRIKRRLMQDLAEIGERARAGDLRGIGISRLEIMSLFLKTLQKHNALENVEDMTVVEEKDYPAPHKMKKLVRQASMNSRYEPSNDAQLKKDYDKHVRNTLRDPKHSQAHKRE